MRYTFAELAIQGEGGPRAVSLDVRAEGHKQVLRITNYNAEYSLYKPRRRDTASLTRQDSMSSSQDAFEAVQETVSPVLTIVFDLHGIGVSLINRRMVEVVYLSLNALKFEYAKNPLAQSVNLSCGTLQIDNQLHDALFPVVLQPTPISQDSKVAALPTVQASMIWLNDEGGLHLVYTGSSAFAHDPSRARRVLRQVLLNSFAGTDCGSR